MDLSEVMSAVTALEKKIDAAAAKAEAEGKNAGSVSPETKSMLDNLGQKQVEIAHRLLALEQKGTSPGETAPRDETPGAQFVKTDAYRHVVSKTAQAARLEVKNTVTTADALTPADRQPGIRQGAPRRRLMVESLIPTVPTTANSISWMQENVFTNNAAEVAEAAAKPESSITFTQMSAAITTVAHWIKITEQLAADEPALVAYINQAMRYGVDLRVENQLIAGNGVAPNMSGLMKAGSFTAHGYTAAALAAKTSTPNALDLLRLVIGDLMLAGFAPSAILMNPTDWTSLELLKDGDGNYMLGGPGNIGTPAAWRVPLVPTAAMAADTFLVADFDMAATIYDRQALAIELGRVNDDFTRNLLTLRAERRLGLAVDRPAAMRGGDLTPA